MTNGGSGGAASSISCSPSSKRRAALSDGLASDSVSEFCRRIPVPFEKLLKTAFGYRNMSRKDIENAFQAEEKMIKKVYLLEIGFYLVLYNRLKQKKKD